MYNIYGITVFFVFCWVQKRVNTCFATTNLRKKMIGCIGKFAFYKKILTLLHQTDNYNQL